MSLPGFPADSEEGPAGGDSRHAPEPLDTASPARVPAAIADGVHRPLDPRSVPLDRIVWSITTAVLSVVLMVVATVLLFAIQVAWAGTLILAGCFASIAGLALLSYFWPAVEYRHASFSVDEQGIEIRRGVVWRRVIAVPRSRVQHIDVSQGPLERLFGLGTMRIYTAGTAYARVSLQGLDHALALGVRDHLLPHGSSDAV